MTRVARKAIGPISATSSAVHTAATPGAAQGLADIDREEFRMRPVGTHDSHMELVRKRDIGDEPSRPPDQRRVFQPLHTLADPGLAPAAPHSGAALDRTASTASRMLR